MGIAEDGWRSSLQATENYRVNEYFVSINRLAHNLK